MPTTGMNLQLHLIYQLHHNPLKVFQRIQETIQAKSLKDCMPVVAIGLSKRKITFQLLTLIHVIHFENMLLLRRSESSFHFNVGNPSGEKALLSACVCGMVRDLLWV